MTPAEDRLAVAEVTVKLTRQWAARAAVMRCNCDRIVALACAQRPGAKPCACACHLAPRRIQLARTKGYRKPAHAVVVSRPSKWGNPYRVGQTDPYNTGRMMDAARAVEVYRLALAAGYLPGGLNENDARAALRGYDLACWCPLGSPCHADVLLRVANS